jgi:hypothetical protein
MFKRRKIKLAFLLIIILLVVFFIPGTVDYLRYRKTVVEAEGMGYPWQCGVINIAMVQPGCQLVNGVCTCTFCEQACVGYDQVIFIGQSGCNGATYACVLSGTPIKGGGTSLMAGVGGQGIFAGTTNMMMGPNDIIALPGSLAARNIDKFVNWLDKYIIAGIKGSKK